MKFKDKIIWDSGFGYDTGIYIKEQGVMYNTCLIELQSGRYPGKISVTPSQVIPYSTDKIKELSIKYNY